MSSWRLVNGAFTSMSVLPEGRSAQRGGTALPASADASRSMSNAMALLHPPWVTAHISFFLDATLMNDEYSTLSFSPCTAMQITIEIESAHQYSIRSIEHAIGQKCFLADTTHKIAMSLLLLRMRHVVITTGPRNLRLRPGQHHIATFSRQQLPSKMLRSPAVSAVLVPDNHYNDAPPATEQPTIFSSLIGDLESALRGLGISAPTEIQVHALFAWAASVMMLFLCRRKLFRPSSRAETMCLPRTPAAGRRWHTCFPS